MTTAARWMSTGTLICTLVFAGAGCGDPPAAPKGADSEIGAARSMVDSGDSAVRSRDYPRALSMYKSAKEKLEEGRSHAKESEMSAVKSLADTIREKIDEAELKQVTDKVEPKVPVVTEVKKQEDAEAKQKAEEAKKKAEEDKKVAAAREKNEKLLTRKDSGGAKGDDDPAVKPGPDKGGEKSATGGDKKPVDGDAEAAPPKDADPSIAPAKPPYPAVTDKSPEIQIIKIATKGRFVYAYFMLFNKTEDDKRINVVNAFFKDKDNQTMIDHGAVTFPFEGFKLDTHKDMIGEQVIDAMTLGSDVVTGRGVRRYVVVGEHDRAKDIKKVSLQVVWQDGNPSVETGP